MQLQGAGISAETAGFHKCRFTTDIITKRFGVFVGETDIIHGHSVNIRIILPLSIPGLKQSYNLLLDLLREICGVFHVR